MSETTRIRFLKTAMGPRFSAWPGEVLDLPAEEARQFIAAAAAVAVASGAQSAKGEKFASWTPDV